MEKTPIYLAGRGRGRGNTPHGLPGQRSLPGVGTQLAKNGIAGSDSVQLEDKKSRRQQNVGNSSRIPQQKGTFINVFVDLMHSVQTGFNDIVTKHSSQKSPCT